MGKKKALFSKHIYTAASPDLIAGYVAIDGNKIEKIVPEADWDAYSSTLGEVEILDFSDGFLMPGFNDYHVHMNMAAMMEHFGTVRTAETEEEAARLLFEKNKDKDPDKWIMGGAWDHFIWPGQKLPTKATLDKYFPNTPVFAKNKECHGAWLSSEALRRFNITKDTPDPPNGQYFRDENGEPTGYVHELAMPPLEEEIVSGFSDEEMAEFSDSFAKMAVRLGVTSVADLPIGSGTIRAGVYRVLAAKPGVRIHFSAKLDEDNEIISALTEEFSGPIVRFNGAKGYLDGTPMGYTGYMVEPYSDRPGFVSEPLIPPEVLFERVAELDGKNIRVRLHCCADGAVRLALDAYEYAVKKNGLHDMRHAIEHIEVIQPSDIGRFAELGVIASVQPEHTPRTHFATHPFHRLLGEERIKYAWPFKSIEKTGAYIAFGTDFPVVDFTPFKGLFRAVNRLTNELEPEGGFNPWEKLSLDSSLRYYTLGSAYACGREDELGTLEAGKLADITVLGRNPFEIIGDKDAMFNMEVKMTMIDGEIVHQL